MALKLSYDFKYNFLPFSSRKIEVLTVFTFKQRTKQAFFTYVANVALCRGNFDIFGACHLQQKSKFSTLHFR